MDENEYSKQGWKHKISKRRSKTQENVITARAELDIIADGGGDELVLKTKSKVKGRRSKSVTEGLVKEKKKAGTKIRSSSHRSGNSESFVSLLELTLLATNEYIQQKREEESKLKKFGSITPKTIKDIQKLEVLIASLDSHRDMLMTMKQSRMKENKDQSSVEDWSLLGLIKFGTSGEVRRYSNTKIVEQCELLFWSGLRKYKMKGTKKSEDALSWNMKELIIQPIPVDEIVIKVTGSKVFGKSSGINNASLQIETLIESTPQVTEFALNKDGSLKIKLNHVWMPFDFNDIPSKYLEKDNKEATGCSAAPSRNEFGKEAEDSATNETDDDSEDSAEQNAKNDLVLTESASLDEEFLRRMRQNSRASPSNLQEEDTNKDDFEQGDHSENGNKEIWAEALHVSIVFNHIIDDYRGRFAETELLETKLSEILSQLLNCIERHEKYIVDDLKCEVQTCENPREVLSRDDSFYKKIVSKFTRITFTCDQELAYVAIIAHLRYSLRYLEDVGAFGPLKVKEIFALHRLHNQGKILGRILDFGFSADLELEDFPEIVKRRTLLEFWRSCCDGETDLSVDARILGLELESEFGREVKRKHPDVANKIFHELICRLLGQQVSKLDGYIVTIFQLLQFCEEVESGNQAEDLSKTVDRLGLEMFLNSALRSDNDDLILVAIKKVGTLLALRTSNLCALAHLLLSRQKLIRSAAAAHIIHIGKDVSLRDKALASYVELLESTTKRDRQSSCVALGFLGAKECIPQLTYLYHSDVEEEVREAATHALNALGDEGKMAVEFASSTLISQTMAQRITMKTSVRIGTAL